MDDTAPEIGESGFAGAVASQSDVVANGCEECSLSSVQLDVWQTPARVVSLADVEAVLAQPSAFVIAADGHYRVATDAGYYLVCTPSKQCVPLEVTAGQTTTLNVKLIYGPTQFYAAFANAAPKPIEAFHTSSAAD